MKVARWGNSLAIRIPADVASALALREGDDVHVTVRSKDQLEVEKKPGRSEALEGLRALASELMLPPGWTFARDEIYEDRTRRRS